MAIGAITAGLLLSALLGFLLIRAIVVPLQPSIGYFGQLEQANTTT